MAVQRGAVLAAVVRWCSFIARFGGDSNGAKVEALPCKSAGVLYRHIRAW